MLKVILVPLTGRAGEAAVLTLALRMAMAFDAHLDVLYVRPDPLDVLPPLDEDSSTVLIDEMLTTIDRDANRIQTRTRTLFETMRAAAGVPRLDRPGGIAPGSLAPGGSAGWRVA